MVVIMIKKNLFSNNALAVILCLVIGCCVVLSVGVIKAGKEIDQLKYQNEMLTDLIEINIKQEAEIGKRLDLNEKEIDERFELIEREVFPGFAL